MKTIKISEKGQIAIPLKMRKEAGLAQGDELLIIEDDGRIMLQKAQKIMRHVKDDFSDLRKHSTRVAEKLWSNKADDIWDTL